MRTRRRFWLRSLLVFLGGFLRRTPMMSIRVRAIGHTGTSLAIISLAALMMSACGDESVNDPGACGDFATDPTALDALGTAEHPF
jgi:hypothetical protein